MKNAIKLIFVMVSLFSTQFIQAQFEKRSNPNDYNTPVMKAIAYGLTAPNPHNTQSWYIDTLSETEMFLYVKHVLPETDPPARQIIIGAGCFIECLAVGMTHEGFETQVEYLPQGDYTVEKNQIGIKPIAKITLAKSDTISNDILYNNIYQRQSNRSPYKGKMITEKEFDDLRNLTGKTHSEMLFINNPESMKPYQDIFYEAMEIETITRHTSDETRKLFRFSETERQEKKDGLSLPQSGVDGIMLPMIEKSMKNGDSLTWHSERMVKATMKSMKNSIYSAKGIVMFKTETNTKTDWIKTGRDFARYNIAVAKKELATSHYNQVIQEYGEMQALQKEFNTLTKTRGDEKIQLIVRIGRANPTYTSWRRNAEDYIYKK